MNKNLLEMRKVVNNLLQETYLEIINKSDDVIVGIIKLLEEGNWEEAKDALEDLHTALEELI